MTSSLARLFSTLFPTLVTLFCIAVLGGAGLYYMNTGYAVSAVAMAIGGLAGLVALFGMVAVQMENNVLLHRIAEASEAAAMGRLRPVAPGVAASLAAAAEPAGLAATRAVTAPAVTAVAAPGPALRRAPPQGRVEPVLSGSRPRPPAGWPRA
ncbi:hypothetical protein SAMN04488103_107162 [Gemmobacter aquatilis]|uniref:Uncharacterized protein n=1 Tax=Gemmobacter aquatilis TaxID=933059 RepID=A0A1H8J7S9_9RHOB|nr:hypothetical protein [Gemmobacter aquatilis]SEN76366.1 hypothetical protein SAMN04488103_107162 [Gemmobacter aquatilis]